MTLPHGSKLHPCWWDDAAIAYIDQHGLPEHAGVLRAADAAAVIAAIESGSVAGTGAIDLFAAFGVAVVRQHLRDTGAADEAIAAIRTAAIAQAATGVALERAAAVRDGRSDPPGTAALRAVRAYKAERVAVESALTGHALTLLPTDGAILTHGATGALSTGAGGTAVAALIAAVRAGRRLRIFACEAQPRRTGERLVAYELRAFGVTSEIIADAAAAALVGPAKVAAILTGAQRIAANGDVLAETGTFALALAAAYHRIPHYVTAPAAAFDPQTSGGPGFAMAPGAVCAADPTARFDVTPGRLISAFVTEYGILRPPHNDAIASLRTRPQFAALLAR